MIPRRSSVPLILLVALLVLPATACAPRTNSILRTEIQDLQNRIYELQKRNAEAEVEIQELRERSGKAPDTAPGTAAGEPTPRDQAAPYEEPQVPGSTIDLGEMGPQRHRDPVGEGPSADPAVPLSPGAVSSTASGPKGSGPGGEEPADKLYVQGYAQFNGGNFQAAQQTFQEFLARSPESDLADDAQYWVGESFFSMKDYRRAILEFRKVIDQYPFGNRVPHAFLKLGLSYLALGDRERAAENLETVVQAFPKSDVATVARATLDEIHKP